jgi:hypothetical protein
MVIILIILAAIFVIALGLHLYKRIVQMREARMAENEYNAAVALWSFARVVKSNIDDALRQGSGVLDFTKIMVPHCQGYRITLELAGYNLRVCGAPVKHNRTARLSFFIDNSLVLRAADHLGEAASDRDPEYTGNTKV